MKRSDMILDIASELVREETDFLDFGKALIVAEFVLTRIEKEEMMPPFNEELYYKTWRDEGNPYGWEPENE